MSVRVYRFDNGEIERVETVRIGGWENISFVRPAPEKEAFERLTGLYKGFIVPRKPEIFGRLGLFCLPRSLPELPRAFGAYEVDDPLVRAHLVLKEGARLTKRGAAFSSDLAREVFSALVTDEAFVRADGRLPFTKFLPVSVPGFLSRTAADAAGRANTQFFTMDAFDLATPFDVIGTPVGLTVKDGVILTPPLFHREALIVRKDGRVSVEKPALKDISVRIGGCEYFHGGNAYFYERPDARRSRPGKGTHLVITGHAVTAVRKGGSAPVPASGFTLYTEEDCPAAPGDPVSFGGMDEVLFAIQAGASAVTGGEPAKTLLSPFCNMYKPWETTYPPSLYPRGFDTARAPRMAIGADRDGNPLVLWAEGMGKHAYRSGEESRGATLAEMGRYCLDAGFFNAVNLDGGGSAELFTGTERALFVSDRDGADEPMERGVPAGIAWR